MRARELLVVQTLGEVPAELALTAEADAALAAQAGRVDQATVVRLLELLAEAMEAVRAGADARTRLELALVKAARPEVDGTLRALLARIERLERGAGGAQAAPVQREAQQEPEQPKPAQQEPEQPKPVQRIQPQPEQPKAVQPNPEQHERKPEPAQPEPERASGADLATLCSLWPAVVELVRGEHALLGALIAEARPVAVDGEDLTVAFAPTAQFLKKKAEDPANRAAVSEGLAAVAGGRWRLSYELRDEPEGADDRAQPREHTEQEWVARFMREFDAEEVEGEWDPAQVDDGRGADERDAAAVTSNEKGA